MSGELSQALRQAEHVPAEMLHAGDQVVIERNGEHIPARIITTVHGSDMVSNFVILGVETADGTAYTWPFPSECQIERTYANAMAAA